MCRRSVALARHDRVDFNDFLVLQNNFNKPGNSYDQANFDYSAATDFNDFLILQNNFGRSIAGTPASLTANEAAALSAFAAAVPEPAFSAILLFGDVLTFHRRQPAAV